jgi:hypothetical protein
MLPEGFPSRDVTFDPIVLGSGDYSLDIFGTATGPTIGFTGTLGLAAVGRPYRSRGAWD